MKKQAVKIAPKRYRVRYQLGAVGPVIHRSWQTAVIASDKARRVARKAGDTQFIWVEVLD